LHGVCFKPRIIQSSCYHIRDFTKA